MLYLKTKMSKISVILLAFLLTVVNGLYLRKNTYEGTYMVILLECSFIYISSENQMKNIC